MATFTSADRVGSIGGYIGGSCALGGMLGNVLGGIGGRFYHTMANLPTLFYLAPSGVKGFLGDGATEGTVLLSGTYEFAKREDVYVSLFTAEKETGGVTLRGLKYPLTDATLTNAFPVGVSNEFVDEKAMISFKKGSLYLMFCHM